ncbi:hypothetical protein B7494_g128 [Chlorociboria aeruginascens]|nr:hypothetical protein B7494_g128 [Chlorociboria aeruginascens]
MLNSLRPSVASTFPLFPTLAAELRLKIWQYACSPRVVEVRNIPDEQSDITARYVSSNRPPTILHVCHESRQEALKVYHLTFATVSSPPHIYFNPYRDTLYVPRFREMGYDNCMTVFKSDMLDATVLEKVRWIAMDAVDPYVKRPWEPYNKVIFLRSFLNLEHVILVLDTGGQTGNPEELKLVEPKADPEMLLHVWAAFRQSISGEQKNMQALSEEYETEDFVPWIMPTLKIKSKACS